MRLPVLLAALLAVPLTQGCTSLPEATIAGEAAPRHAVHFYLERPFQAIPKPDPFILGVLTGLTEDLVLAGYDVSGTTYDPVSVDALRDDLAERNEKVPGTVGIHLTFVEAPLIVTFGTTYSSIACTIYDSNLQILLRADLEPPEPKTLGDLLLPSRFPEANGRRWGHAAWRGALSFLFAPRG